MTMRSTHKILNHIHTILPHGVDILYDVYLAFFQSLPVEGIQGYKGPRTTDSGTKWRLTLMSITEILQIRQTKTINQLIDWIVFYAKTAIFRPATKTINAQACLRLKWISTFKCLIFNLCHKLIFQIQLPVLQKNFSNISATSLLCW